MRESWKGGRLIRYQPCVNPTLGHMATRDNTPKMHFIAFEKHVAETDDTEANSQLALQRIDIYFP